MKRISLALLSIVAFVCASPAQAQDKYPVQAGQSHGAVRRRQRDRHHHPHRRRADAAADRPGFLIENKPGVFGILAIEEMAKPPYDGYTLQVGNPGINVLTPIIYKDKFKIDYEKEVTMVTRLGEIPLILAATTWTSSPRPTPSS